MKRTSLFALLATGLLTALTPMSTMASALGTGFNYQGRLDTATGPASGWYEFQFSLWTAGSGPTQVGSTLSPPALLVTNGLFSITLDFGASPFAGDARWLAIAVRTNGGATFTLLAPRQPLTPTPHALYSPSAGAAATAGSATTAGTATVANNVSPGAVTSAGIASGQVVKSLNALRDNVVLAAGPNVTLTTNGNTLQIAAASGGGGWSLSGNGGTSPGTDFLGTIDNRALELKVNGQRAWRLEPTADSPNVIGGFRLNAVTGGFMGGTIAGGGNAARPNEVDSPFGTIGGGSGNSIQIFSDHATIAGGLGNLIRGASYYGAIGGGASNNIIGNGFGITLSGGAHNNIGGSDYATLGGGAYNALGDGAHHAVLAGGYQNVIGPDANDAVISGGSNNIIQANAVFATIAGGERNLIRTNAFHAVIGGGQYNEIQGLPGGYAGRLSIIGGGLENTIEPYAHLATIGGGTENRVRYDADGVSIAGGYYNQIGTNADRSAVGGGEYNVISNQAQYATIPGGIGNVAGQSYAFAAGNRAKANHQGSFVWADSQLADFASTATNQFSVRATGGVRLETGGAGLSVDGQPILSGPVGSAQIAPNAVNSSKIQDGTVTPADLNVPQFATTFWKTDGNAGTTPGTHFLGTADNKALEVKVNNARALRLEPGITAPNLIGGYSGNTAAGSDGAVIAGGGSAGLVNTVLGPFSTIGGGRNHTVETSPGFNTIGGGDANRIQKDAFSATIAGGAANVIGTNAWRSTIGGGQNLSIGSNAAGSVIAGGVNNSIAARSSYSAVGGGLENHIGAASEHATVSGGVNNTIGAGSGKSTISGGGENVIGTNANRATIGGGGANVAYGNVVTIGGGANNVVELGADGAFIGGGVQNSIGSNAVGGTIAGGGGNQVQGLPSGYGATYSAIGGGQGNVVEPFAYYATVAGGNLNRIQYDADVALIGGGAFNRIGTNANYSVIAGGVSNIIGNEALHATIPGGSSNLVSQRSGFAAGTRAKSVHLGAFVWADTTAADFASTANNQFLIRANGNVGINKNNPAQALDVNGNVAANAFFGNGANLTGIGATALADNSVTAAKLASDPASLAKVTAGGMSLSGSYLSMYVGAFFHDREILLRGDGNHGLGWYGGGKSFTGFSSDGPVLYGCSGGGLGTMCGGQKLALQWDNTGNVFVDPSGINTGTLTPGLTFGPGSGEGISSKRTAGAGQFGLDFYTSFANRMTILQNGNVGIGTVAPGRRLHVQEPGAGTGYIQVGGQSSTAGQPKMINFGDGDYVHIGEPATDDNMELKGKSFIFTTANGNPNAGSVGIGRTPDLATGKKLEVEGDASKTVGGVWAANSDARIKTGVQPLTNALDTLSRVRLVSYRYTDEYRAQHPSLEDRAYANVVAQEFQEVFPDYVKAGSDTLADGSAILQVDASPLIVYSAAAVQELNQQLKAKDARIAELERRLERIEQRLNVLADK